MNYNNSIYHENSANLDSYDLGYNYQRDIGVEKDERKAFIYYQKSAEIGDVNGIFQVGYCYRNGTGIEKDEHKAFIYYQKCSEMGDALGMRNVGYCYQHGIGVEKNEQKAFIYYQKSAEMGNIDGIYQTGYCYQNGIGVEKDEHKAFIYYQKSSELWHAKGHSKVEKDEHKAFIYFQKSADMDDVRGTYQVAYCYNYGIGVEKNIKKAFEYYQKSADMEYVDGIYNVGRCYENGIGVEKDIVKAFGYYQKSSYMGHIDGIRQLIDSYVTSQGWTSGNMDIDELMIVLGIFNFNPLNMMRLKGCSLEIYGLTQNTETKEFMMVFQYANKGNLREFLKSEFTKLNWEEKLWHLLDISKDLARIHEAEYIHGDFHSGNILLHQYISNIKCYIADLGLSRKKNDFSKGNIYGVMPYIAPEVLIDGNFTQAADIYGFGVIMAEMSTGERPYDGYLFDKELAIKICRGLRP
ncbi:hypothetical protein C2G38_2229356 [Gigaspora rosea]|uniref:Protein kinase domain-containing protein n=1 Tax=Gigaspora rosea TaxID=44941 RepID=A0A397U4A9_9GLOM|nr:hypothetical protein C2G38_2229356 [Gigaspora rosea]